NNVLAVMRGQAELLQDDLAVLDRARARVESMQRATDRAAGLTDDLMSFSRRRVDEPVVVDMNDLIVSLESMILQLLGNAITLELRPAARHPAVFADPNRLEQAIVNLVLNARDAMPLGGRLMIVTSNAKQARRSGPGSRLPPAVVLTVSDDGVGIDAQTRSRIFEPFFTTKPPGSGTGLGLSTTEAIVRSCQGSIAVHSEAGAGASFVISLPGVAPASDVVTALPEPGSTRARGASVLVVDDEPDARVLVAETLRADGYDVVEAADGEAALAAAAVHQPDLLVTDVVMPRVGGVELADRLRRRSPGTRVLYVSGHAPAADGARMLCGAPLLTKPLRRTDLLAAVRHTLQGSNR